MNRLKEIRQSKKLTQRELGDLIGVTWNKIKDIENNRLKLTPEIAQKLEEVLSISGWWLLTGRGEKYINNTSIVNSKDRETITINTKEYIDVKEIMEIIELLKYADKEVLDKIKTNLTKLKEVKEAF